MKKTSNPVNAFPLVTMTMEQLLQLNHLVIAQTKQLRRDDRAAIDYSQFKIGTAVKSNSYIRPRRLASLNGTVTGRSGSRIIVSTVFGAVRYMPESLTVVAAVKKTTSRKQVCVHGKTVPCSKCKSEGWGAPYGKR